MQLLRSSKNPVLLPDPSSEWETYNVFNPAVIRWQGLFHMFYRAQGLDWISRIGYAVSTDGLTWNRLRQPILTPQDTSDARGVEDPRVTPLEGEFIMAYTAYGTPLSGAAGQFGITPMLARSQNLITWERIGPLVTGEDDKDHLVFPRKIGGAYFAFHRRTPVIWSASSPDLIHWPEEQMKPVFGIRPENGWDAVQVGSAGVPIETDYGWLFFYHAYDHSHTYRLGVCLLEREDPTVVIHRPKEPIFEPSELWELRGDVPNVVFSCANVLVGDEVYVYYGGADHVIGLATAKLSDLIDFARFG